MAVHKRSGFRPGVTARVSARARIVGRHIGLPVRARFDSDADGNPRAFFEAEVGAEKGAPVRYVLAFLQGLPCVTGDDQEPLYVVTAGDFAEASAGAPLPLLEAVRVFQAGALRSAKSLGLARTRRRLGPPAPD